MGPALVLSAGQRNDAVLFEAVMARTRVPRPSPGRPRARPKQVSADRVHSSRAIRNTVERCIARLKQ